MFFLLNPEMNSLQNGFEMGRQSGMPPELTHRAVPAMQMFQGLDIATNKVTPADMAGVPHHLLAFLAPDVASFHVTPRALLLALSVSVK